MYWNWKISGIALGLAFLLAVALVKPIGVSTQFVILDGMLASVVDSDFIYEDADAKSGYGSTNAYFDKSGGKYAKSVKNPISYGFVFVLCMIVGGLLGRLWGKKSGGKILQIPEYHLKRFGESPKCRYLITFLGGVIVLFGARIAGGCTSGHMMSGMMQTSLSGYIFAICVFAVAVPTAMLIYKEKGGSL